MDIFHVFKATMSRDLSGTFLHGLVGQVKIKLPEFNKIFRGSYDFLLIRHFFSNSCNQLDEQLVGWDSFHDDFRNIFTMEQQPSNQNNYHYRIFMSDYFHCTNNLKYLTL